MKGQCNISHTTLQPEVKTLLFLQLSCALFRCCFPHTVKSGGKRPEKLTVGALKPTTFYNVIFSNGEWAEGMAHWIKCSLKMLAAGPELSFPELR